MNPISASQMGIAPVPPCRDVQWVGPVPAGGIAPDTEHSRATRTFGISSCPAGFYHKKGCSLQFGRGCATGAFRLICRRSAACDWEQIACARFQAMKEVTDRARELTVSSMLSEPSSVLVAVKDVGTGLDPAVAERMFQPFFTTKRDGLGMGLAICRSIIETPAGDCGQRRAYRTAPISGSLFHCGRTTKTGRRD